MDSHNKVLIIGVAGGTGSGKSTFTQNLKQAFGNCLTILYFDNYYINRSNIPEAERKNINYDCPEALDTNLLIEHVKQLKNGFAIDCPQYDFATHTRKVTPLHIEPSQILVVEGILTFYNPELRGLFDLKIFVDSDADERILRRTLRDIQSRGRKLEDIIIQYVSTVKPMHNLYVEPTKQFADIIITGGLNSTALDVIIAKLRMYLENL